MYFLKPANRRPASGKRQRRPIESPSALSKPLDSLPASTYHDDIPDVVIADQVVQVNLEAVPLFQRDPNEETLRKWEVNGEVFKELSMSFKQLAKMYRYRNRLVKLCAERLDLPPVPNAENVLRALVTLLDEWRLSVNGFFTLFVSGSKELLADDRVGAIVRLKNLPQRQAERAAKLAREEEVKKDPKNQAHFEREVVRQSQRRLLDDSPLGKNHVTAANSTKTHISRDDHGRVRFGRCERVDPTAPLDVAAGDYYLERFGDKMYNDEFEPDLVHPGGSKADDPNEDWITAVSGADPPCLNSTPNDTATLQDYSDLFGEEGCFDQASTVECPSEDSAKTPGATSDDRSMQQNFPVDVTTSACDAMWKTESEACPHVQAFNIEPEYTAVVSSTTELVNVRKSEDDESSRLSEDENTVPTTTTPKHQFKSMSSSNQGPTKPPVSKKRRHESISEVREDSSPSPKRYKPSMSLDSMQMTATRQKWVRIWFREIYSPFKGMGEPAEILAVLMAMLANSTGAVHR